MPIHREGSGWQWGNHGKVYPTREGAEKQAAAAHANGFHGDDVPALPPNFGQHAAGILFIAPDGDVLLLRRATTEPNFGGHWGLPGGKAEGVEEPHETARREALEEIGAHPVGQMKLLDQVSTPTGMIFHTFVQMVPEKFAPHLDDEHSGFAWAPLNMLPEPLHPAVRDLVTKHLTADCTGDMSPEDWHGLTSGFLKWVAEEEAEPEHAEDANFSESDHPRREDGKFGTANTELTLKKGSEPDTHEVHHNGKKMGVLHSRKSLKWINKKGLGGSRVSSKQRMETDYTAKHEDTGVTFWGNSHKYGRGKPETLWELAAHHENHMKKSGGAQDAFALDFDSVRTVDADGRLHVANAHISKAVVNPYRGNEIPNWQELGLDPGRIYQLYRDPEELAKSVPTWNGIQLMWVHTPVTAEDHKPDEVVGTLGTNAVFNDPYLDNELVVWAQFAIDKIDSGEQRELSCGYRYRADMTPGSVNGMSFDGVMRDIVGNHTALVKKGRAGPEMVVGDQAIQTEELDMSKVVLSRMALRTQSALTAFLLPRMALDAKLDLGPVVKDVTRANFKEQRAAIWTGAKLAVKGKLLAGDDGATPDDVAMRILDMIDGQSSAEPAEADVVGEPGAGAGAGAEPVDNDADPAAGSGGSPDVMGKVMEFLKGKISDEDMAQLEALCGGGDDDEESESETPEEKELRMKKEKELAGDNKDLVTKPAMDAAINLAVAETEQRVRKQQRAIAEAVAYVRPWVGDIPMAHDSAEEVFRSTLKALSVKVDGVHADALRPILDAQPKPGERRSKDGPSLGLDSAQTQSLAERFPHAASIRVN